MSFAPLTFVPVFGSNFSPSEFKGTTLVLPTTSAGMSSSIAVDLYILNQNATKAGYIHSEYIAPLVFNDALSADVSKPGALTMPCELYVSADKQYTFMVLRSGICSGKMYPFGAVFTKFIEEQGFSNVVILSSTLSPVKRERESNREIPELFAYANNHLYK